MLNSSSIQPAPFVVSVISTKGGVTKSTNVANIGAFRAYHGIKTLMIDTDTQPISLPTTIYPSNLRLGFMSCSTGQICHLTKLSRKQSSRIWMLSSPMTRWIA